MKRTFKSSRLARHMGLDLILKRQMTSSGVSGPVLTTKEMFTYLHKRHVSHISKNATALACIKFWGYVFDKVKGAQSTDILG
jgi:hypothetical protein